MFAAFSELLGRSPVPICIASSDCPALAELEGENGEEMPFLQSLNMKRSHLCLLNLSCCMTFGSTLSFPTTFCE